MTRRRQPPGSAGLSPHWVIGALPLPLLRPHALITIPAKRPNCWPIAASFFGLPRRLGVLPGSAMIRPSARRPQSTLPFLGISVNQISGSPPWRESHNLEEQAAATLPFPGRDLVVPKPASGGIGGAATAHRADTYVHRCIQCQSHIHPAKHCPQAAPRNSPDTRGSNGDNMQHGR